MRLRITVHSALHPVPDIAGTAARKRPVRDSQGVGKRLPCSGAWLRLPENLPLMSAWIAVFSMGEEASMNIRPIYALGARFRTGSRPTGSVRRDRGRINFLIAYRFSRTYGPVKRCCAWT